jgi:hypothetical protein
MNEIDWLVTYKEYGRQWTTTMNCTTREGAVQFAIARLGPPTLAEQVSIEGPHGERISDAQVKALRTGRAAASKA